MADPTIKIYVINMDGSPDRLARMSARLSGLSFERLPAVDGRKLPSLNGMSGPERGALGSHKLAWQHFLASDSDYACVLEDDAVLSDHFADFMRQSGWLPESFDIINLEAHYGTVFLSRAFVPLADGHELYTLCAEYMGAGGYIVNRSSAARLVKDVSAIDATAPKPVDILLFGTQAIRRYDIKQITPGLCTQELWLTGSNADSSIESSVVKVKPPRLRRIWREICRPFVQLARLRYWLRATPKAVPFTQAATDFTLKDKLKTAETKPIVAHNAEHGL